MGLLYHHLDDSEVRTQAVDLWISELETLEAGYQTDDWPYGKLLTAKGLDTFKAVMPQALSSHDDDWLATQMASGDNWLPFQVRKKPKGGVTEVDYDRDDALLRLAVGEFNTAYVRGVASQIQSQGQTLCRVYRAGQAAEPRHAYCTDLEGLTAEVEQILADHRANYWPTRRSGARPIPSGAHCHHSIQALDE